MSQTAVPELMDALLEQFEVLQAPIGALLRRPGVGEAELDEAQALLRRPLPAEVRDWFRTQDGWAAPTPAGSVPRWPNGLEPLSLDEALERRNQELQTLGEPGDSYSDTWLPLLSSDSFIVSAVLTPDEIAAVRYDSGAEPRSQAPVLPSITDLLRSWLELAEAGALSWDTEQECWELDHARVPEALRFDGLVL